MELNLLFHNIVSMASGVVAIGLALFTYLNGPRQTANITVSMLCSFAAVFAFSHLIGVNVSDPEISRIILMFNLSVFLISSFQVHSLLAILGQEKEKRWIIWLTHVTASALIVFFIIRQDLFLLPSVPKLYFPNYYVPGILNTTRIIFMFMIVVPYSLSTLYQAYRNTKSNAEKNRYRYFLFAIITAYITGLVPNFLVYDIPIDPLWGMTFGLFFAAPFIYGALKYQLLPIKIVAKQAFLYSLAVAAIGGLIVLLNYSAEHLTKSYPAFPKLATPFISAMLVVTASVFVWHRLREDELLKYEFINTVTHKFRTPLTYIKWIADELLNTPSLASQKTQIEQIINSDQKLVELTETLLNVSNSENKLHEYKMRSADLLPVITDSINAVKGSADVKKINLNISLEPNLVTSFDPERIKFVVQVLIENAIHYTPEGGTISILAKKEARKAIFSVTDSGMGISKEDLPRLFAKFYRSHSAELADTEGMGIGLYISKAIIEKHSGKIWADSKGQNKGSTFSFSIPTK